MFVTICPHWNSYIDGTYLKFCSPSNLLLIVCLLWDKLEIKAKSVQFQPCICFSREIFKIDYQQRWWEISESWNLQKMRYTIFSWSTHESFKNGSCFNVFQVWLRRWTPTFIPSKTKVADTKGCWRRERFCGAVSTVGFEFAIAKIGEEQPAILGIIDLAKYLRRLATYILCL